MKREIINCRTGKHTTVELTAEEVAVIERRAAEAAPASKSVEERLAELEAEVTTLRVRSVTPVAR